MNYKELDVYTEALRFLPLAARLGKALPRGYASFAEPLRTASLSIVTNIGEGSGKTTRPDPRRFYAIARGSAMECGAIVDAFFVLGFIETEEAEQANELLDAVVRMLSKMARPPGGNA